MKNLISPKYFIKLAQQVAVAIESEYRENNQVELYFSRWHEEDDYNWQNFQLAGNYTDPSKTLKTLNGMPDDLLLKIAVDMGVETPDYIPVISYFRNEIKSDYATTNQTFEKALRQVESHPDIAVGLANSALESIIKEIFKDDRFKTKPKDGKTLYDLAGELLKEFNLYPHADLPIEIKSIGSKLLAISKSIETLRSENTIVHGKTSEDYVIDDPLFAYFIVNAVTTVGLFLNSFYKRKFPKQLYQNSNNDDLPF